jgi:hypothetical protein
MSAIPARFLPLGNLLVFSPLGLSFVDDFTGEGPVGYLRPTLQAEVTPGSGQWQATGVRGLFTPGGVLAYPNLGRRGRASQPPTPRNHRVLIDAQYYQPLYPGGPGAVGVVFPVTPYDDQSDFSTLKPTLVTLPLLPAANYPYFGGAAFLSGQTVGASGQPRVALVTAAEPYDLRANPRTTRVPTDASGHFRLPLRWGFKTRPTTITAADVISGDTAPQDISYPYDLSKPLTITIPNV